MYDQVTAHDAVSNANVDAYNQYVKTSRDNAGSLPDLSGTLPDKITAPVSVTPPASVGTPARRAGSSGPTHHGRQDGHASGRKRSGSVGQGPTGVWTPPTPPVTQAPPQSTTTQSVNPVSTSQPPISTPTTVPPSGSGRSVARTDGCSAAAPGLEISVLGGERRFPVWYGWAR